MRLCLERVNAQAREAKRHAFDFTKLKRTILKLGMVCTMAPDSPVELVRAIRPCTARR